jgi:hypothetical protein
LLSIKAFFLESLDKFYKAHKDRAKTGDRKAYIAAIESAIVEGRTADVVSMQARKHKSVA